MCTWVRWKWVSRIYTCRKRWVDSQYLPLEWIMYCVKAGAGDEEFASHFFTWQPKHPHTVGVMEHIFLFLMAGGESTRGRTWEITRKLTNGDKQHWCHVLWDFIAKFCVVVLCFSLWSSISTGNASALGWYCPSISFFCLGVKKMGLILETYIVKWQC